jgi:hypothetical protein
MSDRRGSRFVLEVLFLLALAVALTLTNLSPLEIAGVMLVGWVVVALFEWAAWREEPHYGSGLPPRYYVPQVNLPPAQPLEQVATGYPEARDEAPTWIASAALRDEMLGEWPVAAQPVPQPDDDDAVEPEPEPAYDGDPWTRAEELPVAPLGELVSAPAAEPEPVAAPIAVAVEPEPEPEPEPVAADPEPEPEPELEPAPELVLVHMEVRTARWSIDPLAEPEPRRRFRRRRSESAAIEVPARPEGVRQLPGRGRQE